MGWVKEGSGEAGIGQGGQHSSLNFKLWVFLFCEMAQRCLQEQACLSYQCFYLEPLWCHWPYFLWRKQVAPLDSSFLDCQLVTQNGIIYILYSALARPGKAYMWAAWHLVAFSNCFSNELVSPCFVIGSSAGAAGSCWPPSSHSLILSWAPRNLAVSFLWADLVGYAGKVLKDWRPHILDFLDNSDRKYCVLLSECVFQFRIWKTQPHLQNACSKCRCLGNDVSTFPPP